jgi:hypothetical protein
MSNEVTFFWIILAVAFSVMMLAAFFIRALKTRPAMRTISGYEYLPMMSDAALETDRPLHVSIGSAAIGQQSTLTALAGFSLMYALIERQAFTRQVPLFTLSDPVSLAIAQDTVRRAYVARQNRQAYRSSWVVWFPQGDRSVAYGAGAASMSVSSNIGGNVLAGQFGGELAFVGEASARHDQMFVGHSTSLEGQAVAFAQSDATLIGEEIFVGGAYLTADRSFEVGGVIALDILRWAAIIAIIVIAIIES